jgi:hypothetical protein
VKGFSPLYALCDLQDVVGEGVADELTEGTLTFAVEELKHDLVVLLHAPLYNAVAGLLSRHAHVLLPE